MAKSVVFIDAEVGVEDRKIHDIGAVRMDGACFHSPSLREFYAFLGGTDFVCGHNIVHHDLVCLGAAPGKGEGGSFQAARMPRAIDTLYLSPLLFPKRPYHSLLKDDKLQTEEFNNPVNDCKKAKKLFFDEINAFDALPATLKQIYYILLSPQKEFSGFFEYTGFRIRFFHPDVRKLIRSFFKGRICSGADLGALVREYPVELAYALALIRADDEFSITPPWVLKTFPKIENVFLVLRGTPCPEKCEYCQKALDIHRALRRHFNYDSFRLYAGEPLQEKAVQAAVDGKSLLAVFPTGGGKSLTFQLPALMAGSAVKGLTVVISPLQSLMKDQVDNLAARGVTCAVTVNGLLDPIERADSLARVADGSAHLLYISPEQLRSKTIGKLVSSRNVVRFVIDEAHCFSAWGQDFRVDYLYIADFIRELQTKSGRKGQIPVSCFTATAKQKVITDIRDYFKRKLDLDLEIFATDASRENLRYYVIHCETDEEKYNHLRNLISRRDCPAIVYVSHTKRTRELAQRLTQDGFPARPYHGKMEPGEKVLNQEAFIRNEVQVIVATSAFGMGVDKKDVRLVVHYDISSSLEDYVQEAGRAGRDPGIQADCYVLYNDNDLDKHFILLNQTKLSISEIQQVWKAVKDLTRQRPTVCCSPLEIARQAGWNESGPEMETRVRTAVQALETAGYVKRGQNMPRVYATGITSGSTIEAVKQIDQSGLFTEEERQTARRIISSLISKRSIADAGNEEAESRIDYLADILGLKRSDVIHSVNLMRQAGILDDTLDMTASIQASDSINKSRLVLDRYARLEWFLFDHLTENGCDIGLKELNEEAQEKGIAYSSVRYFRTLLYYLAIKNYINTKENYRAGVVSVYPTDSLDRLRAKTELRLDLARFILDRLYGLAGETAPDEREEKQVNYSLIGLYKQYQDTPRLDVRPGNAVLADAGDNASGNRGKNLPGGQDNARPAGDGDNASGNRGKNLPGGQDNARPAGGGDNASGNRGKNLPGGQDNVTPADVADALLYLSKTGAMKLEGGFLVLYNGMEIRRLVMDNRIRYKLDDYRLLDEFYKQKIRQIHIVGEYANLMVRDYNAALQYVSDYFKMDHKKFIDKYFGGDRKKEIDRNITPEKYRRLFDELSEVQAGIIADRDSRRIVVAAGPGSGKTRVLVHKLASLLLMEDVKHDRLLMLTFSRAAATEFKKRLAELIGNAANFVDIKTFHSYCFDLLGRVGSLAGADDVVENATAKILSGEVEPGKIMKSVLVIDEAQDMSGKDFALIRALMRSNEDMRVIAVGDDDQNIFAFRGSDSKYLRMLVDEYGATKYEMTENYRSLQAIVALSNAFAARMRGRMKTAPGVAVRKGTGKVVITHHRCRNFLSAVADEAAALAAAAAASVSASASAPGESACILTRTNEEALQLVGFLQKKGIRARLIESLGKQFRLSDLAEIRFFLSVLDSGGRPTAISDELWVRAKEKLYEEYKDSACREIFGRFFGSFEADYPERYRTDLDEFIAESQYEDFYPDRRGVLYVSTIHKAKGREFDTVYMLLQGFSAEKDEEKRLLYVGMTRAKSALYIHCNTRVFDFCRNIDYCRNHIPGLRGSDAANAGSGDGMDPVPGFPGSGAANTGSEDGQDPFPGLRHIDDPEIYSPPDELLVQLSHSDVYLDYFKPRQELVRRLRSGMRLFSRGDRLCVMRAANDRGRALSKEESLLPVISFSKSFRERLSRWAAQGYYPAGAIVRFVVAWKGEKDEEETLIALPVMKLRHRASGNMVERR